MNRGDASRPRGTKVLRWIPWIAIPGLGGFWAAYGLRHTYFFYDEWSMIDRVVRLPFWAGTTSSFNGHLWMLQYWLYRAQTSWFGVDDNAFIKVVFICALIVLHVAIASVLRGSGIPTVTSLLLAALLTYLGVASQNFLFAVQVSPTLSLALGVAATALVLTQRASLPMCIAVGTLTSFAVGVDSGTAIIGVTLVAVAVVISWRGLPTLAVAPGALALVWWYLAGDLGPPFPADLRTRFAFGGHLLLRAVGGLAGRTETAGLVLLIVAVSVIAFAGWRRWITGPPFVMLIAGTTATAAVTIALSQSRAGMASFNFVDFNRYLQSVALPFVLAVAPVIGIVLRRIEVRTGGAGFRTTRFLAGVAVPGILATAFVSGLAPMRSYARGFVGWNQAVRERVRSAASIAATGCPSGKAPDPASLPAGDLSPQISTQLIIELLRRNALRPSPALVPDAGVVARMCPVDASR